MSEQKFERPNDPVLCLRRGVVSPRFDSLGEGGGCHKNQGHRHRTQPDAPGKPWDQLIHLVELTMTGRGEYSPCGKCEECKPNYGKNVYCYPHWCTPEGENFTCSRR